MSDISTGNIIGDAIVVGILLCMSALFSGLTLGLLSRSLTALDLLIAEGTPTEREQARKIYVVRKDGYLLLATLLVGNVCVNTLLSIIMTAMTSGLIAFIGSTAAIVIFGEILPQAICARHPLYVGSRTAWLVIIIRTILYPIVYPISRFLTWLLGEEAFDPYSRSQLRKLVEYHSAGFKGTLTTTEKNVIGGVLDLTNKKVKDVMIPVANITGINGMDTLSDHNIQKIISSPHRRIPVYRDINGDKSKREYIGILRVNDVLTNFSVPESERAGKTFYDVVMHTGLPLPTFSQEMLLSEALHYFQKERMGHIAIVTKQGGGGVLGEDSDTASNGTDKSSTARTVGMITLTDIVNTILQFDMIDVTDDVPYTPLLANANGDANKKKYGAISIQNA